MCAWARMTAEGKPVREGEEHALFGQDARALEKVGEPAGHGLHLGVGEIARRGPQRDPVAATLPDPVVEEVIGDVEGFLWRERHGSA